MKINSIITLILTVFIFLFQVMPLGFTAETQSAPPSTQVDSAPAQPATTSQVNSALETKDVPPVASLGALLKENQPLTLPTNAKVPVQAQEKMQEAQQKAQN